MKYGLIFTHNPKLTNHIGCDCGNFSKHITSVSITWLRCKYSKESSCQCQLHYWAMSHMLFNSSPTSLTLLNLTLKFLPVISMPADQPFIKAIVSVISKFLHEETTNTTLQGLRQSHWLVPIHHGAIYNLWWARNVYSIFIKP